MGASKVFCAIIFPMTHSIPEFRVGRSLGRGAEHRVYVASDGKRVLKFPHRLGRFTQDMSLAAAQHDLETLDRYDFPYLSTELYKEAVLIAGESRQQVGYLLVQPHLDPYRAVGYPDFLRHSARSEALASMMEKRHRIFKQEKLGVDLIGFAALSELFRVIWHCVRRKLGSLFPAGAPPNPRINNLVIMPDERLVLTDVRLIRLGEAAQRFVRIKQILYDLQTAALAVLMDCVRQQYDRTLLDLNNWVHRFGQWAANQAFTMVETELAGGRS